MIDSTFNPEFTDEELADMQLLSDEEYELLEEFYRSNTYDDEDDEFSYDDE
jgi:hypothetical protein